MQAGGTHLETAKKLKEILRWLDDASVQWHNVAFTALHVQNGRQILKEQSDQLSILFVFLIVAEVPFKVSIELLKCFLPS